MSDSPSTHVGRHARRKVPFARSFFIGWALGTLLLFPAVQAATPPGGGPENVLVVVNQNSAASLELANWYIFLRKIPPSNVVYLDLAGEGKKRLVSLEYFREQILRPVLTTLDARGLAGQIDLIVYSADFPTAVNIKPLQLKLKEELGDQADAMIRMFNAHASLNAMTFYAGAVLADAPSLFGLDANWYYRRDLKAALAMPFVGEEQSRYAAALDDLQAGRFAQALTRLEGLAQRHPQQFAVPLAQARAECGLNRPADAALALTALRRCGWQCRDTLLEFQEIASLQQDSALQLALKRFTPGLPRHMPSQAFYRRIGWAPNGGINGSPDQCRNYYLSSVLAVLSENGMTLSEAKKQLLDSVRADGSQPRGTIYFSLTNDVRTRTRQPGFAEAVEGLKRLGVRAQVVRSELPPPGSQVLGAFTGTPTFDWEASGCHILPGGIVDNLTSFGGMFHGPHKQTQLTELTRRGAAGSSGTVCEPYATQVKFAHPRIFVHYAQGCNLAESFYQSVQAPFQLLIVGDALCAPWAQPIDLEIPDLPTDPVSGVIQWPVASPDLETLGSIELFVDGIRVAVFPRDVPVALDTRRLPDGYHELRIVGIANTLVANQSRRIFPVQVANRGEALPLTVRSSQVRLGGDVLVETPTRDHPVEIFQNSRRVATIPAGQFQAAIPSAQLGAGAVQLSAVSRTRGRTVHSAPVTVEIE